MTIEKLPKDGLAQKSLDLHFLKQKKTALLQQKNTNLELIKNWRSKLLRTEKVEDIDVSEAAKNVDIATSNKNRLSAKASAGDVVIPTSVLYGGMLQKLTLELEAIQGYILPLLYGLLGASVYVLRTLSARIKTNTYTEIANINLKIRLFLGMLGGMVIAWFVTPENSGEIFKSLSPFALAFLAGYSIELLFASMDRIIGAFTGNAPSSSVKPQ